MSLNFKNRIAFHYMFANAIIMAVVFTIIYFVVFDVVIGNLDNDLSYEAHKHLKEVKNTENGVKFKNKEEWEEREHREVEVNPVFIQLIDANGQIMDKSPNLKEDNLQFNAYEGDGFFDAQIGERLIRQIQLPFEKKGKISGYILAAVSSESAFDTLLNLRNVLIISYLFLLIGLYVISRFLAGRSISPVTKVTDTIARITKYNLKERVELPQNKDEIHELSLSFNSLLDRIENALERERQFTSDASHELRTPLATLRGTLEVLIRKPRNQDEYEDKIKYSLKEIDKMVATLEQLLLLARLDSNGKIIGNKLVDLSTIMDESISRLKNHITEKKLRIDFEFDENKKLMVPQFYTHLIIENIVSNAIKYSNNEGIIHIQLAEVGKQVVCQIKDHGIGIKKEDLKNIYDGFFRSDALDHKHIKGNGLGLSIVKKCAEAINATLTVDSVLGEGTTVTIKFPESGQLNA